MNNQILGEKKRTSFDDNLADYINQIYDKMPDEVVPDGKIAVPNQEASTGRIIVSKEFLKDSSGQDMLTQDQWLNNWNDDNGFMMSMSDLYKLVKQLRAEENNWAFLDSATMTFLKSEEIKKKLLEDILLNRKIITSTRIRHVKDREFEIIHHYKCKQYVDKKTVYIPKHKGSIFNCSGVESFLETSEGLSFMQVLFNTSDNARDIIENLTYLFTDEEIAFDNRSIIYTAENKISDLRKETACVIYRGGDVGTGIIGTNETLQIIGRTRGIKYA